MSTNGRGWVHDNILIERLGLTHREGEILAWVTDGKTNGEIGVILGTSPRTVQKHMEHIFKKLGVETRTAAAVLALSVTSSPVTLWSSIRSGRSRMGVANVSSLG